MDFINNTEHKKCLKIFFTVLICFLIAMTILGLVNIWNQIKENKYIGQEIESKNTINVTGEGEIYTKPDLAVINFSVVTEKSSVAEAISENTKKMNQVVKALEEMGVEEKDLKTSNFSIYPLYSYPELSIYSSGRVIYGHEVNQTLEVKVRDLEKIGELIQEGTSLGVNQIGNLTFAVDNQDEFKKQAREEAIKEAKDRAEEIADQLGVDLVKIIGFNETSQTPSYRVSSEMYYGIGGGGGGDATEIQTGENRIWVSVSISYEIN